MSKKLRVEAMMTDAVEDAIEAATNSLIRGNEKLGPHEWVEFRADYLGTLLTLAKQASLSVEELRTSLLKGDHSSLTFGFNDLHACNYMTAQQWADEVGEDMAGYNDLREWVSPEEREKPLATNSVWSVQWYPDTPVGFHVLYASTFAALLTRLTQQGEG